MRAYITPVLACGLFVVAHPCWANNSYFLPGDAFFHTVLTEEVVNSLAEQASPRFANASPNRGFGYGCGSAGYTELEFVKMPKAFKQKLKGVYDDLRKEIPKQVEITEELKEVEKDGEIVMVRTGKKIHTEINGFSLLFYNASFDFNRHRLCLKYNERWVEETVAFGHRADLVRLEYFVDSADAVANEWRDAATVKPLDATCPKLKIKRDGEQLDPGPVRVTSGIRAIILRHHDFKSYYHASPHDSHPFFEVQESGIQRFAIKEGKWQVEKDDEAK